MALVFGGNANFTITDTGTVARDLSTYIQSLSMPLEGGVEDVTTFGAPNLAKMYARSMNDAKITLKLFWDGTPASGPDAVLSALRTFATPSTFTFTPQGAATGNVEYTGNCLVTKWSITSEAEKYTTGDLEIQTTGGVTHTTHT